MNSRQQKTWKALAIGGLFATTAYLVQRTLFSNSAPTDAPSLSIPSTGFLANCNATLWHLKTDLSLQSNFQTKIYEFIFPAEREDDVLVEKIHQAKSIVAKSIVKLRANRLLCAKDCDYISLVLAHPDFRIFICKELKSNAFGIYRPDMHAILFDITILTINTYQLEKLLLHEFWHAYMGLVHTRNQNPENLNLTVETNPAMAYLRNATDATSRRHDIEAAIDKGDKRILDELPKLVIGGRKGNLTPAAKDLLRQYKNALADYTPEYFYLYIDIDAWEKIAEKVEKTLEKGGTYEYVFELGQKKFSLYVQNFKREKDYVAIHGYSTPSQNDKLSSFIYDTRYRMFVSPNSIRYEPFGLKDDTNLRILTEQDAYIAQLGEKIKYLFYPELMQFHHCEHNEAFIDLPQNVTKFSRHK